MNYVALLRGINVGGKNTVSMAALKQAFEQVDMRQVSTYINSGNVVFKSDLPTEEQAAQVLEQAIEDQFGFAVKVLVRSGERLVATAQALPDAWVNDSAMKCDVLFLWPAIDNPAILEHVVLNHTVETARYVPGALLWSVKRQNIMKGRMVKLVGTAVYKQMTIRNCNTVRILAARVAQLAADE